LNYKKTSLRLIGLIGSFLFIPLLIFTFLNPQLIENYGQNFIEWKLGSEIDKKIDSIQIPKKTKIENLLAKKAEKIRKENEIKLYELKIKLKNDVPILLSEQLIKMRKTDCECRNNWNKKIHKINLKNLISLEKSKMELSKFSQTKYMEIVENLTFDMRIFFSANSFIFLMLLILSFLKPQAINHLILPSCLMVISTIICSYFYLFEQNWFYTLIYNDYTGFSFIGYLFIVFSFLSDISFNKARLTSKIINSFCDILGMASNISPC
jgi:hypothetical protein